MCIFADTIPSRFWSPVSSHIEWKGKKNIWITINGCSMQHRFPSDQMKMQSEGKCGNHAISVDKNVFWPNFNWKIAKTKVWNSNRFPFHFHRMSGKQIWLPTWVYNIFRQRRCAFFILFPFFFYYYTDWNWMCIRQNKLDFHFPSSFTCV